MVKSYYTSSVSPKGQITLPMDLRKELAIEPKDIVVIELEDGNIPHRVGEIATCDPYMRSIPALDPPRDWNEIEPIRLG